MLATCIDRLARSMFELFVIALISIPRTFAGVARAVTDGLVSRSAYFDDLVAREVNYQHTHDLPHRVPTI